MKPFIVNRFGRIVFPFNFFPELDFSVFHSLEQFAAVIKRDFEEKAPTEADIVASVESQAYAGRYEVLRDLALHLFWVTVAAASGAASVRVWHIMSRGWDPWTERPLPEGIHVACPLSREVAPHRTLLRFNLSRTHKGTESRVRRISF